LQFGFAAGQQRSPTATSPTGQHTTAPPGRATRTFGQQVFTPPTVTHVSFALQHVSPQQLWVSGQQWSPQHFSPGPQHPWPQQVCVFPQQWSPKQHFWFLPQHLPSQQVRPVAQQVRPQRRVPFGQLLRHRPW
jgi:hypothetical protein